MEVFNYAEKAKCLKRFLLKDKNLIILISIYVAACSFLTLINIALPNLTNISTIINVGFLLLSIVAVFTLLNSLAKKINCKESNYNIERNSLSCIYIFTIFASRIIFPIIITFVFSLLNNLLQFSFKLSMNMSLGLLLFQLFLFAISFALLFVNKVSKSIFYKIVLIAFVVNTLLVLFGLNDITPIIFLDYVFSKSVLFLFNNYVIAFIIVVGSIFSSLYISIKCFENICRNK